MTKELRFRCRHFNGVQNDKCEAGVAYASLTLRPLPCINEFSPCSCPSLSLLTADEREAEEERQRQLVGRALENFAAGLCPTCGANIEPSRKVGRCLYGACGHRIGQVQR